MATSDKIIQRKSPLSVMIRPQSFPLLSVVVTATFTGHLCAGILHTLLNKQSPNPCEAGTVNTSILQMKKLRLGGMKNAWAQSGPGLPDSRAWNPIQQATVIR